MSIARNALFQATSISAGAYTAALNPDADGVQRQAGEMTLSRDEATFLQSTQLGSVSDRYQRNPFGEPTFYEAKYDDGASPSVLFSESYSRDKGGRIKRKDVRVVNASTGTMESYAARYEYYPTGQLHLVQYNDQPVIEYTYDTNNNLIGEPDDDVAPVASLWMMDASGATRCQIAVDWDFSQTVSSQTPLPDTTEGVSAYLPLTPDDPQLTTPCTTGTVLQPGDRLVAAIGYRCLSSSAITVEAAFTRGGTGPVLSGGGDPTTHTCGQPGYIEIDGAWSFASPAGTPCTSDSLQSIPSRRLESVTIAPGTNQVARAILTEPDGTPRDYSYTYDANGALDTKTDTLSGEVTDYDYDDFGNLRNVALPDNRTIEYLIDAANRRVGRVLRDAGGTILDEKRYLYQSALRPVAELDGNDQVVSFFVYVDKPNVPEYMVRVEGGQNVKYRIVTDHLGSVRLLVNADDGTIAQRIDYDEWGNVTQDTNPGFQPFGFAGGGQDHRTALVHATSILNWAVGVSWMVSVFPEKLGT